MLAQNAESILTAESPRTLRTVLSEAALRYELTNCRVTLGDGTVVADGSPHAGPAAADLAATLPSIPESLRDHGERVEAGAYTGVTVIGIGARGEAVLEVSGPVGAPLARAADLQTGAALVGGIAICGLFLSWRSLDRRFRSLTALRGLVLRAAATPDARAEALRLGVRGAGAIASAWNTLMTERDELRERACLKEAIEALGGGGRSESGGHSAVDALWLGVMLLDREGKVHYANGAAAAMLSVRREEVGGASFTTLFPEADLQATISEVVSGRSRNRASAEIERVGAGSGAEAERSVFRVSVKGLRKEDSAVALVMIEDVTQQRAADEARNAFVAQATHELRTPLTNMRLYIETLVEDTGEDPAVRAKCLNVIGGESRRLERIVGDMLSVSEIEAGSLKIHEDDVRLDAVFADLKADFSAQAEDREMTFVLGLPPKLPVIKGDRDKLMLTLHNLVGNAIKYTPPGGAVRVIVRLEAGAVHVDVTDNGIGIRPEECEKVFERFYRAKDKRIGSITGSGLGLALARQIARLHGGDISVRSELDKGSTFTLTLPSTDVVAIVGAADQRKAA